MAAACNHAGQYNVPLLDLIQGHQGMLTVCYEETGFESYITCQTRRWPYSRIQSEWSPHPPPRKSLYLFSPDSSKQVDDGAFYSLASVRSHTFMSVPEGTHAGIIVPQLEYTARAVSNAPSLNAIQFRAKGMLGIRLVDVMDKASLFSTLDDATEQLMMSTTGILSTETAKLRIIWPGYDMWADDIRIVMGSFSDPTPITRAKLAHNVAKGVRQCLYGLSTEASKDPRPDWHVTRYSFEQLVVLELRHVSSGSWQPVLAVVL
ncbi:hypothetical protein BDW22DRAFT_1423922 [Trametopsis cervina]|nr:hypothetical protein BDW22DRAFT_1423922 [Trametopsis cervina]